MDQLKWRPSEDPCPFCGGEFLVYTPTNDRQVCQSCGICASYETQEDRLERLAAAKAEAAAAKRREKERKCARLRKHNSARLKSNRDAARVERLVKRWMA